LKFGQPSDIQKTLAKQLKQVQELSQATADSQKAAAIAEEGLKKRRTAKEFIRETDRLFSLYDKDADGMLSRKEAKKYAMGEFGFKPTDEVLDRVWKHNVEISEETLEERIGIKRDNFRWLRNAVGVGRELSRNGKRKADRIDKERVLVTLKEKLKHGMADATRATNAAEAKLADAEVKLVPLKVVTMDLDSMSTLGEAAEAAIAVGRSTVIAVRNHIDNLAIDGVELRCREDIQAFLKHELRRVEAQLGRMEERLRRATNLMGRFRRNVLYKQAKALCAELEVEEKARAEEEEAKAKEEQARAEEAKALLKAQEPVDVSKVDMCVCGGFFNPDAKFCMKCGSKRPEPQANHGLLPSPDTAPPPPPPAVVEQAVPMEENLGLQPSTDTAPPPSATLEQADEEALLQTLAKAAEAVKAPENGEPVAAQMRLDLTQQESPQPNAAVIRIQDGEDEADLILQSVAKDFGQV